MSADYPYDTNVVRELLKGKRKSRGVRSCFPCRHRKVRCEGQVPCSSCVNRNHPELCRVPTSPKEGYTEQPRQKRQQRDSADPAPGIDSRAMRGLSVDAISFDRIDRVERVAQSSPDADSIILRLEKIEEQIASLKADLRSTATTASVTQSPQPGACPYPAGMHQQPASKFPGRHVIEESTGATIYLGSQSDTPLALGCLSTSPDLTLHEAMVDQSAPMLYPFTNLWGGQTTLKGIYETLPDNSDIIRYWQAYQLTAHPFYPALVTIDQFARALLSFLGRRASWREAASSADEPDPSWIALLFAVLACGVHFSDDPAKDRDLRSKVLICSSFECLRMSNIFKHANLDQIQAMTLIAHCLRNNIDANSAWILMGTTIRLAQSIGLHEASPSLPESEQSQRSKLWWMIIWQDTFLSFTYDRPISVSATKCPIPYRLNARGLTFQECIFTLCRLILDKTHQEAAGIFNNGEYMRQLDEIRTQAAPFLTDKSQCVSLQDHLERLALGVHLGYMNCRLNQACLDDPDGSRRLPADVAANTLHCGMQVVHDFLDLHRSAAAVCRSWAFVHNTVSCAIMVRRLREISLQDRSKLETLIQKLTAVLEEQDRVSQWRDADANIRYVGPYSRGLRALHETAPDDD